MDIFSVSCVYYCAMNHPVVEKVNEHLQRFVETGVVASVVSQATWNISLPERRHERRTAAEEVWVPMTLAHLLATFLATAAFLIVSVIIFVLEKLHFMLA